MREIKFRIWDNEEKTMIENKDIYSLDFRKDIYFSSVMIDGIITEDDYKLMQYTGLKDKNGKEVYGGDILSYKHIVYTDCSKTEIEKIEDEAFIEIINYAPIASVVKPYSENVKCFGYDSTNNQCLIIDLTSNEVEVKGNIYENLELVK